MDPFGMFLGVVGWARGLALAVISVSDIRAAQRERKRRDLSSDFAGTKLKDPALSGHPSEAPVMA